MRKRISAGALAFVLCLSLIQPTISLAVSTRASPDWEILDWRWTESAGAGLTHRTDPERWELSVSQEITERELLELLPEEVEALVSPLTESPQEPDQTEEDGSAPGDASTPVAMELVALQFLR